MSVLTLLLETTDNPTFLQYFPMFPKLFIKLFRLEGTLIVQRVLTLNVIKFNCRNIFIKAKLGLVSPPLNSTSVVWLHCCNMNYVLYNRPILVHIVQQFIQYDAENNILPLLSQTVCTGNKFKFSYILHESILKQLIPLSTFSYCPNAKEMEK